MNIRTAISIAKELRPAIGGHVHMIGDSNRTHQEYEEAQSAHFEAVAQAKYLICNLADRHAANVLARALGMPGYINMR
jgi:hypothetical protein